MPERSWPAAVARYSRPGRRPARNGKGWSQYFMVFDYQWVNIRVLMKHLVTKNWELQCPTVPLLCSQYVHDRFVMFCILWRYIIHFWTNLRARRHETQGLATLQQKMARGELTWSLSQLLMACSHWGVNRFRSCVLKPWWRHIITPRHQDATLAHHVTLADQSSENPRKKLSNLWH